MSRRLFFSNKLEHLCMKCPTWIFPARHLGITQVSMWSYCYLRSHFPEGFPKVQDHMFTHCPYLLGILCFQDPVPGLIFRHSVVISIQARTHNNRSPGPVLKRLQTGQGHTQPWWQSVPSRGADLCLLRSSSLQCFETSRSWHIRLWQKLLPENGEYFCFLAWDAGVYKSCCIGAQTICYHLHWYCPSLQSKLRFLGQQVLESRYSCLHNSRDQCIVQEADASEATCLSSLLLISLTGGAVS